MIKYITDEPPPTEIELYNTDRKTKAQEVCANAQWKSSLLSVKRSGLFHRATKKTGEILKKNFSMLYWFVSYIF